VTTRVKTVLLLGQARDAIRDQLADACPIEDAPTLEAAVARAAEIARYRRRGWSEARIARAMTDKARADARPAGRTPNEDAAYWIDLLTTLSRELELNRLALMHHFYSKSPGSEPEIATRRKAGRMREAAEVLASMGDAVIHDFEIGEAPK
jgi:hypothetical protein